MKVVIVKYNAGNIQSVKFALNRIGINPEITDDPQKIRTADRVIFPGVGEASTAMDYLKSKKLDVVLKQLKNPFLGICLGMQLMCEYSEENNTECLGIFKEKVLRFSEDKKVPHVGWNNIVNIKKSKLFYKISDNDYLYFVHSYYIPKGDATIAECKYDISFSASMKKDNFMGCQFHPEKSGDKGEQILKNFIEWKEV